LPAGASTHQARCRALDDEIGQLAKLISPVDPADHDLIARVRHGDDPAQLTANEIAASAKSKKHHHAGFHASTTEIAASTAP